MFWVGVYQWVTESIKWLMNFMVICFFYFRIFPFFISVTCSVQFQQKFLLIILFLRPFFYYCKFINPSSHYQSIWRYMYYWRLVPSGKNFPLFVDSYLPPTIIVTIIIDRHNAHIVSSSSNLQLEKPAAGSKRNRMIDLTLEK